jgi:hypothetical protein
VSLFPIEDIVYLGSFATLSTIEITTSGRTANVGGSSSIGGEDTNDSARGEFDWQFVADVSPTQEVKL